MTMYFIINQEIVLMLFWCEADYELPHFFFLKNKW